MRFLDWTGKVAKMLMGLGSCLAGAMSMAYGAGAPEADESFRAEARGFGSVEVTLRHLDAQKRASLTTFAAEIAPRSEDGTGKGMESDRLQ